MKNKASYREFDWLLVALILVISAVGIVEIYSVTAETGLAGQYRLQVCWVLIGLVAMLVISRLDYHMILGHVPWIYLGVVVLLGVLLVAGEPIGGARRWIHLGGLNFQVSEIAKLVIIMALARYFAGVNSKHLGWKDIFVVGVVVSVPLLLVALQPDLGTALTFVVIALAGVVVAGIRIRQVVLLALAGALLMPAGMWFLKPYQQERLRTFIQPEADIQGSGYQINQSKIAIGSGGFWGKGLRQGTQNRLGFIPGAHTDFIFAVFAEEHGFVGTVFVLLLYLLLLMRLLDGAQSAVDRAGSFLVMGFAAVLFFQITISTAMIIGLAPVTGIPLPLMTYGGSSALFTFMGFGLALSVRMRRFVN